MTYPQYQQPQGYGQPQPTYAPAPAQQQGQPIAPPMPTLRDGGGNGGTASPKMRHLLGRTIIVEPIRVDETATEPGTGKPRPEAYFHLTVVDGGPLQFGDNQDRDVTKQRPNTHEVDTPCRFTSINDYGFGFVQAVRDALASNEAGRVGVVQQGTRGNKPYLITKCGTDVEGNARPDGDARYAAAMELFGKIWADRHAAPGAPKQFVSPEPRSLVAPPAQQSAPPVNYGAPAAQPAYGYGPQAPAPSANGYYMPGQPTAAPAAPSYPQYVPPAPAAPQLPPAVEAWLASLPAGQAAGARAQYLAQQAAQPVPAGPGM